MKTPALFTLFMIVLSTLLTSCEVIGGIFKAGMGFGIFIVLAVLVVIVFLFMKMFKK